MQQLSLSFLYLFSLSLFSSFFSLSLSLSLYLSLSQSLSLCLSPIHLSLKLYLNNNFFFMLQRRLNIAADQTAAARPQLPGRKQDWQRRRRPVLHQHLRTAGADRRAGVGLQPAGSLRAGQRPLCRHGQGQHVAADCVQRPR